MRITHCLYTCLGVVIFGRRSGVFRQLRVPFDASASESDLSPSALPTSIEPVIATAALGGYHGCIVTACHGPLPALLHAHQEPGSTRSEDKLAAAEAAAAKARLMFAQQQQVGTPRRAETEGAGEDDAAASEDEDFVNQVKCVCAYSS
jgi:hypothetical protein